MKAIVIHAAKDLRVEERSSGVPGSGQVALKIGAGMHRFVFPKIGFDRCSAGKFSRNAGNDPSCYFTLPPNIAWAADENTDL